MIYEINIYFEELKDILDHYIGAIYLDQLYLLIYFMI